MDKDKEKELDDVGLQREFDRYIKTTISQVADHVVKKYSHSIKRPYVFSTYRDGTQIGESAMIVIDSKTGEYKKIDMIPGSKPFTDNCL